MKYSVRKAVFPVAGLGTRFLPVTKTIPKELLPVGNKPLIQWAVEEAYAAGIEEFCFVKSPGNDLIDAHFRPDPDLEQILRAKGKEDSLEKIYALNALGPFVSVTQSEPLGLGHAVWSARDFVGEDPFAVILPDDFIAADRPCLQHMMTTYATVGGNMTAVMEVEPQQTAQYGIFDIISDDGMTIQAGAVVEKPDPAVAPSNIAIIGRYLLDPAIMTILEQGMTGSGGEIQLTDAIHAMIPQTLLRGHRFSGHRFDCGNAIGFAAANAFCAGQ